MTSAEMLRVALGAGVGALLVPTVLALLKRMIVEVEDEHAALVQSFGKLDTVLSKPGLHVLPSRALPWVKVREVSLQRDFRLIKGVHLNDAKGTTVIVDLWVELQVVDPAKAYFRVASWERSLQNLISHEATALLSNREFDEILAERDRLGEQLRDATREETERWGVRIEGVFLQNVGLMPEVGRQMLATIAARLEAAKAEIEEEGRLQVAQLEAETTAQVAGLVADAKAQYPLAVGRALEQLRAKPGVYDAYTELYKLSLLRPHRTVTFVGFGDDELRAVDAAMLQMPASDGAGAPQAVLPALSSEVEHLHNGRGTLPASRRPS